MAGAAAVKRPKSMLALGELTHVLKDANLEGEEEEEEEDTQIQSSLPFYFEHIFGRRVGFSQDAEAPSPRTSPSHGTCKDSQVTSVMESQPFSGLVRTAPSPPPQAIGCGSELSAPLFPSPGDGGSDQELAVPAPSEYECTAGEPPSRLLECPTARNNGHPPPRLMRDLGAPGGRDRRKRKSSRTGSNRAINDGYCCPPSCTPLVQCTEANKTVNLIALVVQVNSAMDVSCRKGPMVGQTVQMSSLLLSDPTKSYFKLSLWRAAAVWAERIAIGDIVYFKSVRLKVWKDEFVGTTTMYSSVLNLHQPTKKLPSKVQKFIPEGSVTGLMSWGKKCCGYLFGPQSIPKSQREVKFRTSRDLMGEPVIHCHAKLLQLISPRVVLFADHPELDIHLHLLGEAASLWSTQLTGGVGQVWELMYVAVLGEGSQTQNSICTLQTTSRTRIRMLEPRCDAACEVLKRIPSAGSSSGGSFLPDLSVMAVISNQRSGTFRIKARALSMEFILPEASKLSVGTVVTLEPSEMITRLCQAVYVGCESCSEPLVQDDNGVYCQCMPCIMKSPGGYPASSYFFRPMLAAITDGSLASITLTVSQTIAPKVFGLTARDVVQSSLSSKGTEVVLVQRLKTLFGTTTQWLVNCLIIKDENSFLQELSFSLVDVMVE